MKIQVPIIKRVDLVIVGGSSTAIDTAVQLKQSGHSVFLITPYTYLGEDLCAGLNLHETPQAFGLGDNPRPTAIKLHLEQKLLDANIDFLFQSNPIRLVYGKHQELAGLLIGNRSGFQIIAAKAIFDATDRCLIADMAGLPRKPFRPGKRNVQRIVLGEFMNPQHGLQILPLPCHYQYSDKNYQLFMASMELEFPDNTAKTLSAIEVSMRKATWQPQLVVGADQCLYQLNDGISISYVPGAKSPFFFAGRQNPAAITECLKAIPTPEPVSIQDHDRVTLPEGIQVTRNDSNIRFRNKPALEWDPNSLPVLEHCQVLIVGGGTGGAPAAIAAGRAGANTLCLETTSALGGLCTMGRIGSYWFGNRVGFCEELDQGITAMAPNPKYPAEHTKKDTEWKRHWLLLEGDKAGVEFRFQHTVLAAAVKGSAVCGALVGSPWGNGIILTDVVVDATGNADLAIAAGAKIAMETFEPAVQGAGLPPVIPGNDYTNTDYNFIRDEDVFDTTRAFLQAHHKFADDFDIAQIVDTRERRRIVGDLTLQPQDFYAERCYHDTITIARSNFDTHGFIVSPMFMLQPPTEDPHFAKVPFRALLPAGLENILVTGLAVSAHRDCLPLIRMQPDVHNQGYAAGKAAAEAASRKQSLRALDLRVIQKHLVEKKILPPEILSEEDSIPGPKADAPYAELAAIFLNPEEALPKLQKKFAKTKDLWHAQILAFLGDDSGRDILVDSIANQHWDEGWNYRGMGQFGACVSPLDCQLIALANLGNAEIVFLKKLAALEPDHAFSHFRVMSLIYMKYPCRAAIEKLEALLCAPGMANHAQKSYRDAIAANREDVDDNSVRNAQLKEVYLARALNACQPGNIIAVRSLNSYADGLQGWYARFALDGLQG